MKWGTWGSAASLCRITYLYADEPGELNVADLYERVDNADMAQFRVVGDVEK